MITLSLEPFFAIDISTCFSSFWDRVFSIQAFSVISSDNIIDELVKETKALGNLSQMQIAPEQGQFLQIIATISNAKKCLEIGRFTGLSTL